MNISRIEINKTLRKLLEEDDRILLLGQYIRDPYGGACKVTRGLTKNFNNRIIDFPISEASMIGVATGLAMQGYIPIVEIMFFDFMTLCVDQIHNIAKNVDKHQAVKLIIRTMRNNDKMYGPTHCQDLSWMFENVYDLKKEENFKTVYALYKKLIEDSSSVSIIIEDKQEY
jgi:2-oxoisovalerate dehydrogenase E1 component